MKKYLFTINTSLIKKYLELCKVRWLVTILIVAFIFSIVIALFLARPDEKSVQTADLSREVGACLSLEKSAQLSCVNEGLKKIAKEHGARAALDVLEPLSEEHTQLLDWIHALTHTIGNTAVASYKYQGQSLGNQIGKALTDCDGYGAFGCYHGVIETGFSLLPIEKRTSVIREACMENPLIQEEQYFVNQCLHWFGHGVAIYANLTLEQALAMCEGLNSNFESDDVQLCLSGLFHAGTAPGNSDDALLHNVKNVFKEGDPYYPCLDIEEKFRGQCFSHAPSRTGPGSEDLKLIFGVCDNIPEKDRKKKFDYIGRCYETVANIILPQALRDTNLTDDQRVEKIVAECRKFSRLEYRPFCYAGAARYWVLRDPLPSNLNPFKICKSAEDSSKPICYANIGFGNNENYYSAEKLSEYCLNSEPEYLKDCLARNPSRYLK